MAGNTQPIFSKAGDVQWGAVMTTANNVYDGTGTVSTAFTADATNGGFVQKVIGRSLGTNVATVMRVFVNNGSTNATATNNALVGEITIPATTAVTNSALPDAVLPLNFVLPAGYKIITVLGATVVGGILPVVIGGKY